MKQISLFALLAGLAATLHAVPARAEEKLEQGKTRIDVPETAPGLQVHNLFQSGMVIQRDKPMRVWGLAEPGEKISVNFGGQS